MRRPGSSVISMSYPSILRCRSVSLQLRMHLTEQGKRPCGQGHDVGQNSFNACSSLGACAQTVVYVGDRSSRATLRPRWCPRQSRPRAAAARRCRRCHRCRGCRRSRRQQSRWRPTWARSPSLVSWGLEVRVLGLGAPSLAPSLGTLAIPSELGFGGQDQGCLLRVCGRNARSSCKPVSR